jgi:AraC-like DNA-binding protein
MAMHRDDDYSNTTDFPSRYARRVIIFPLLHTLPVWAVVVADSQMGMAALQSLYIVFNICFLIYVLPSHRTNLIKDSEDNSCEDSNGEDANGEETSGEDASDSDGNNATDYKTELIKQQIYKAVVEDRLFLKPHLTLEDVASKCRYGRTYLSKVFKQELGGFFNYINELRLNYADEYIRNHPLATLDEVAMASGFTSRQAFYSVKRRLKGDKAKK